MFQFDDAPVPVRDDIGAAYGREWAYLAAPGASLSSAERIEVAGRTRTDEATSLPDAVDSLVDRLARDPGSVSESHVRAAVDDSNEPTVVEVIGIVCRVSAVDSFHKALGVPLPPLPDPRAGHPTGEIAEGLKRRRTHIPVGPGPIPNTLDLVPAEGRALEAIHGPQYMTYDEMDDDRFAREPGLNRAQMELISSRTSLHNQCFY